MTDTTTIIHGPKSCGKTRNSDFLAKKYKCTMIVDDWHYGRPLTRNALHLTNENPLNKYKGVAVVDYYKAMKDDKQEAQ